MSYVVLCRACRGRGFFKTGFWKFSHFHKCPVCEGDGKMKSYIPEPIMWTLPIIMCPHCGHKYSAPVEKKEEEK